MDSLETKRPHAVLLPFPEQGHINPMMQLAKLLHSTGFYITFVNTLHNHSRLLRSKGEEAINSLPDFQFEAIPDSLPPSNKDAMQEVGPLCDVVRKNCLVPFLELLGMLNSSLDVPPVTCLICDGVMSFGIKAAQVIGVPQVQLWTASACGFLGYLQFDELVTRGIVPLKDESDGALDSQADWVPGMSNMRLKDMPSFITNPDGIMFDFMGSETKNCLNSSAILFNTFDELEQEVLDAIAARFPSIYTIGPLFLLTRHLPETHINSFRSNLSKEDPNCIHWLNEKPPNSVVYVNYGSVTVMSEKHLKEFAWGLAKCNHPFLWVVRPDIVMGESAVLPDEFFCEIKGRGLLVPWCAQDTVLSHPSVAVFLTHCGWNSIVESVGAGKPLICWPFFAEQMTNCRYACTNWGIGLEVDQDVKRENVEGLVREMMEGENGRRLKENALEWKRKAEVATDVGGSSYYNFKRFIKEALLNHG